MEISSDTLNEYGGEPGWYEGRVQVDGDAAYLTQGQRHARIQADVSDVDGDLVFVKAVLSPGKEFFLRRVEEFGEFRGRHRGKYIGQSGDRVIHSRRYEWDETRGTGNLEDASEIEKIEDAGEIW